MLLMLKKRVVLIVHKLTSTSCVRWNIVSLQKFHHFSALNCKSNTPHVEAGSAPTWTSSRRGHSETKQQKGHCQHHFILGAACDPNCGVQKQNQSAICQQGQTEQSVRERQTEQSVTNRKSGERIRSYLLCVSALLFLWKPVGLLALSTRRMQWDRTLTTPRH